MTITQNEQILMTLSIPRADVSMPICEAEVVLSTDVAMRVWNTIVHQAVNHWLALSQQLRKTLSNEPEYLEDPMDIDKSIALQRLNEIQQRLISMIQSLENWIIKWS